MLDTNEEVRKDQHILHEENDDNDSADSSSRSTKLHQNLKPLTIEVRSLCYVATVESAQTSQIFKVFVNKTNLTFLTFLYKIGITVSWKVSAKNKVASSGN